MLYLNFKYKADNCKESETVVVFDNLSDNADAGNNVRLVTPDHIMGRVPAEPL